MNTEIFELTIKSFLGEDLTHEEKARVQRRNAKYKLVQYIYMEKMNHENAGITQFEFTPGESFEDTPTLDIVNSLIAVNEELKNAVPFSFEDSNWVSNPPRTGKTKTKLGE
jgi:hypothetical protein